MSERNRKGMYDQLVAAKRFADISPRLKTEFGDPDIPEEVEQKAVEKAEKKTLKEQGAEMMKKAKRLLKGRQ